MTEIPDLLTLHAHIDSKLGRVPSGRFTCGGCGGQYKAFALTKANDGKWRCGHCRIDQARAAEPQQERTWEDVRGHRATLLAASDWTELPGPQARMGEAVTRQWAAYRQALFDITERFATPAEVIWPDPPNAA